MNKKKCLSFGPPAVHPDYQRKGIGRALIKTTLETVKEYDKVFPYKEKKFTVPRRILYIFPLVYSRLNEGVNFRFA